MGLKYTPDIHHANQTPTMCYAIGNQVFSVTNNIGAIGAKLIKSVNYLSTERLNEVQCTSAGQ